MKFRAIKPVGREWMECHMSFASNCKTTKGHEGGKTCSRPCIKREPTSLTGTGDKRLKLFSKTVSIHHPLAANAHFVHEPFQPGVRDPSMSRYAIPGGHTLVSIYIAIFYYLIPRYYPFLPATSLTDRSYRILPILEKGKMCPQFFTE